ncbi:MAG TPA: 2Fe-2S iron-sulfur cluster-binding protein [Planctomycetota bacterium]|nr:2Fe-2S iron-sulfur cluster-binding protein [Planctomycetota bacterium]
MKRSSQSNAGADERVCPSVLIDGRAQQFTPGENLLQVCAREGVELPALCYSQRLQPIGSCRACLVEVDGVVRAGCTTPAVAGAVVRTNTPQLQRVRETILALVTGTTQENRQSARRSAAPHPYIREDYSRCNACLRCVAACEQLAGLNVLQPSGRGIDLRVRPKNPDDWLASGCVTCLACIEECPTGALTAPGLMVPGTLPLKKAPQRRSRGFTLRITQIPPDARDGLCLHPDDARDLKAVDQQPLEFRLNGAPVRASAIITARTPCGTAHWLTHERVGRLRKATAIRIRTLTPAEAALPQDDSFDLRPAR